MFSVHLVARLIAGSHICWYVCMLRAARAASDIAMPPCHAQGHIGISMIALSTTLALLMKSDQWRDTEYNVNVNVNVSRDGRVKKYMNKSSNKSI